MALLSQAGRCWHEGAFVALQWPHPSLVFWAVDLWEFMEVSKLAN